LFHVLFPLSFTLELPPVSPTFISPLSLPFPLYLIRHPCPLVSISLCFSFPLALISFLSLHLSPSLLPLPLPCRFSHIPIYHSPSPFTLASPFYLSSSHLPLRFTLHPSSFSFPLDILLLHGHCPLSFITVTWSSSFPLTLPYPFSLVPSPLSSTLSPFPFPCPSPIPLSLALQLYHSSLPFALTFTLDIILFLYPYSSLLPFTLVFVLALAFSSTFPLHPCHLPFTIVLHA